VKKEPIKKAKEIPRARDPQLSGSLLSKSKRNE